MIVRLVAHTVVTGWGAMRDAGWVEHDPDPDFDGDTYNIGFWDADYLAEFAGRLCYQSWDRPRPETATNAGYLDNILRQQHHSVLEHASASFYVAGVSRSLSHELVRHRHLSFSQLSQRFVDESDVGMIAPPAVKVPERDDELVEVLKFGDVARREYAYLAARLYEAGLPRKQAREAARAVLPNMTETRFIVTGNMRAWRDVIAKRSSPHADAEIRELATEFLTQLRAIAPHTFQDM